MRNIALILMYNGSAYHGWQVQKTEITVAETLDFDAPENFCGAQMLLNNYAEESPRLRPYEAAILYYHD